MFKQNKKLRDERELVMKQQLKDHAKKVTRAESSPDDSKNDDVTDYFQRPDGSMPDE